ncbi:Trypsin [Streptoalloteichus tenebrarius]|uniref:Trypsin n=2 Tax=Streptoalloteichus tenebrarius (strain ATCC 17920 / DSM 40477 / JCM 4838 / CBS 697.72 / NBRC 16177 / NCIMB 11028 / NRRL B-12390 / A12253. 1 / ISP 5477) TaxID=1933 RepID=A0ABT1HZ10_STRSD|nr:Trypsin [Streptoalloteichus tenebrarius]
MVRWVWSTVAATVVAALSVVPATAATPTGDDPGGRIVNGQPVSIERFPWMVAVATESGQPFCGGSVVAPTKVLTAAHCAEKAKANDLRVIAGRTNLESEGGTVAKVVRTWSHPKFHDPTPYANDVAVLTVDQPLSKSALRLPARDRDRRYYEAGRRGVILGWGRTSEGGDASPRQLMGAVVPVLSDRMCEKAYGKEYVPERMMCAGYESGGIDACQGDSGGPLVVDDRVVGIISWGTGCARPGKPGVYAKVLSYSRQLQQEISD